MYLQSQYILANKPTHIINRIHTLFWASRPVDQHDTLVAEPIATSRETFELVHQGLQFVE